MRPPGIYPDIDIAEYHASRGISSSGISLILDCPARYYYEYMDPDSQKEKAQTKNDKFVIGSAVHVLALEPEKFYLEYYPMTESVNLTTKEGKNIYFDAVQKAGDKKVLRATEWEQIRVMAHAIQKHPLWSKVGPGKVEHSIFWDTGVYKTRVRARPDFFTDEIIIDLKTTESIKDFGNSVYNYGYHRQAAMQIDGLQICDGKKRHFAFFVVEKKLPHLTACFTLSEEALERGRREYLDGAAIYSECLMSGSWPSYDDEFQEIALPKWATKKDEEMN